MKIALLTFHNTANFGAALQAYALQHYLEEKGFETEYLDYNSHHRRMIYDMPYRIKSSLKSGKLVDAVLYTLGMPMMNMRKAKFDKFNEKYLHISKEVYHDKDELKKSNALYDKFIVGSDQVWNPGNNGKDIAFLLSFVEDSSKTISYASSFGVSEIPDFIKEDYAACFKRIEHLSTREVSGVNIIKEISGREAKLVLDPVFLLTKNQWMEIMDKETFGHKYMFSYTNRKNQTSSFLKTTGFSLRGMKHHKLSRFTTVSDFVNPNVNVKYDMSPTEFITNIQNSELVISASFHCICFSIILNKPFVCFLTGNEGKDERLKTLLTHFGLMDRVFTKDMRLEDVNKPIDWEHVNKGLEEKRQDSIEYLLKAVEV